MAKIKNTNDRFCWRGCGVWKNSSITVESANLYSQLWKSVWQFLRKSGINLPQDSAITPLGIYPKDEQSYHKGICSIMFIAVLFVIARTWKQSRCLSTKEWINKIWYIYSAVEDNDILKFAGQMDGTRENHPE